MTAISIQGLSKRYGETNAVDGLTFSVRKGTITGFLGPNGAGKTTTLRMLLGLATPTAGTATIDGRRYADLPDPFRHVGAVLETTGFHPGRKARDHIRVLAAAADVPRRRVDEVLELVGLTHAADKRVKAFSLGMRQRLGLAAALLGQPEMLILDEPANGLDPEGVHWLRTFLRGFANDGGTVLVSSHLLAEVAQTVDDVVIIANGRLVTQSSLAELGARSRSAVRVRTPQAEELRAALTAADVATELVGPDTLLAWDATTETVGLAAAGAGAVIYEMSPEQLDLEEMFLELTTTKETAQ
jgi:ABC-2 type transport system ATP-binding protein